MHNGFRNIKKDANSKESVNKKEGVFYEKKEL